MPLGDRGTNRGEGPFHVGDPRMPEQGDVPARIAADRDERVTHADGVALRVAQPLLPRAPDVAPDDDGEGFSGGCLRERSIGRRGEDRDREQREHGRARQGALGTPSREEEVGHGIPGAVS